MAMNLKPLTPDEPKNESDVQIREYMYSRKDFIDRVKSGERIFGEHGSSLTWGINGSTGGAVTAGGEGEKEVGKLLDEYAHKHPNVFVFHSIQWPGSNGDTDHMIVCGQLALIIDAKRWKAKRKYSVTPKGAVLRGTVAFPEGKVKMMPAMSAWRKQFGNNIKVSGVVCIAQKEVFVPYDKNWHTAPYRLVTSERLHEYLDTFLGKSPQAKKKLDPQMLITVGTKVIKARDRRAEIINMKLMGS